MGGKKGSGGAGLGGLGGGGSEGGGGEYPPGGAGGSGGGGPPGGRLGGGDGKGVSKHRVPEAEPRPAAYTVSVRVSMMIHSEFRLDELTE